MAHEVLCRICKEKFDTTTTDYVMPSKNWYYHRKCYEDFGKKSVNIESEVEDRLWFDASWRILHKDLRLDINYLKFQSQWKNFIQKKMTPKGIYFALRYFYIVKKGDGERAEGGIGIVPYIYEDSCKYWIERNRIEANIVKKIEDQVRQAESREKVVIIKPRKKHTKNNSDLKKVEMEEDE